MLFLLFATLAIFKICSLQSECLEQVSFGELDYITQDAPGKVHFSCQDERERQHDDVLIFGISIFRMGCI